jgi:hypothetical protein
VQPLARTRAPSTPVVARRGRDLAIALLLVAACGTAQAPTVAPTATPTGQPSPTPIDTPAVTPGPTATGTTPPPTDPATPEPTQATASPAATSPTGNLDGSLAWTQLDVASGPSPREDHTFTLNGDGSHGYLFGGRAGSDAFNDLWRYDLAADSWQLIERGGPAPDARFGHVAVWQPEFGLVVWSGQQSARVFFGDTWAFDPATE